MQREPCLVLVRATRRHHDGGRAGGKVEETRQAVLPLRGIYNWLSLPLRVAV